MTRTYVALVIAFCHMLLRTNALKVTGATGATTLDNGNLPLRYEINDFSVMGPAFDLYILALQRVQAQNQSDMLSYFQLAGIHGFPLRSWDGVTGDGQYPGYCLHGSVLFPTWHRPYLALFEAIAKTYPTEQRNQYQAAALSLRIPYWDWAIQPGLPQAVVSPTISVNGPDGQLEIENPLYQYTFHPGVEGNGFLFDSVLANMSSTVRHYNPVTKQRNDSAATAILQANAPSTLALTYQILTSVNNYTSFSCASPGGQANGPDNIENPHNSIHTFVGGSYGHMTYPQLAAFDPVFWLHHANVDRIFALWQALNSNSYVTPVANPYGSYYEPSNTLESGSTSLAPFHVDNGTTMFTSDLVRDTAVFGYTYPELANRGLTIDEAADMVRMQVNRLYAPATSTKSDTSNQSLVSRMTGFEQAFSRVSLSTALELEINNLEVQWSINIATKRPGDNHSYSFDFFMGALPTPEASSTAPNLIGTYGQFVVATDIVSYDVNPPVNMLYGGLSITHSLAAAVARGYLSDLTPASVVPVLRDHLKWSARADETCGIDLTTLPGLVITVQSRQVTPRSSSNAFPVYDEYKTHPEATACKAGGFKGNIICEQQCFIEVGH